MEIETYYKLWFDDSDPGAALSERHDLKGISEYIMYQDDPIRDWPIQPQDRPTFYAIGDYFEDYLVATANGWEIFSEKVCAVFEHINVSGIDILPVRVVNASTNENVSGYAVVHVWRLLSALDKVHADWIEDRRSPGAILSVYTPALLADAIRGVDIFRLEGDRTNIYLSSKLKKAIEATSARGFLFRDVPVF